MPPEQPDAGTISDDVGRTVSTAAKESASPQKKPARRKLTPMEEARETMEAVAIAFVLAFLFKTFQAEMYVIPTGSMAPTLYGRHKEVACESCQYAYAVGASQEIDQDSGVVVARVDKSECPNCHYVNDILDAPVFNGDRILVNKQCASFDRFDVVVFKNPEEAHVNYIKRLVGLPNETVRIRQGNLYARKLDSDPWRILRKDDPFRQKDIQLVVYDDNHPSPVLLEAGGGERWIPAAARDRSTIDVHSEDADVSLAVWQETENAWSCDRSHRTYAVDAEDEELHWLRYRNLIPTDRDWVQIRDDGRLDRPLEPSLILDFCGFNSFTMAHRSYDDGLFWVGDLTINATLQIEEIRPGAQIMLELIEGQRWYRCRISPETGNAELLVINRVVDEEADNPELKATAVTSIDGSGTYEVVFANVDDRLCLWVNGDLVDFGDDAAFTIVEPGEATLDDLTPVGIAASGIKAQVSDLLIQRDIYYRNDTIAFQESNGTTPRPGTWAEGRNVVGEVPPDEMFNLMSAVRNPRVYASLYDELVSRQIADYGSLSDYHLGDGEYLMFGDNSPASKDSRLFDYFSRPMNGHYAHRYAVQEQDLIGEALFIFWPHGIPFLNGGEGFTLTKHTVQTRDGLARSDYPMYRFPFYPNFSRMKKIR
ncbi:MAG: signal peptidase I [Planctomycetaceae bacterium]